jgi:hypothetical protein
VTMQADRYRGLPHRQTMRMNSQDLVSSGPQAHQRVSVQGEAGCLRASRSSRARSAPELG